MKRRGFVDLFCGAGGLSWGFHHAGITPIAAFDIDTRACRSHEWNFGAHGCTTINEDLGELSPKRMADLLHGRAAQVNVVIGGPPCQGWSKAGRAKIRSLRHKDYSLLEDPRNRLYKRFILLASSLRPEFIVMENVPGMRTVEGKNIAGLVISDFARAGFVTHAELVNAWWFGVPQNRERMIFIAAPKRWRRAIRKGGIEEFSRGFRARIGLGREVSVRDAIGDLPVIRRGAQRDPIPYRNQRLTRFQALMRESSNGTITDHVVRFNRQDEAAFEVMRPGMHYVELPKHLKRYRDDIFTDKYRRLDYAKNSGTITAHLAHDGYSHIHPSQCRTISVREAARLQSFPDSFRFFGGMGERFRQIGNAVPPLMAFGIAQFVVALASNPSRWTLAMPKGKQ